MNAKLLLLSNSTLPGEAYLQWPRRYIQEFLGTPKRVAFVPFAAVAFPYDTYARMVQGPLEGMGHRLVPLHEGNDPVATLDTCEAVVIGGGNSFQLLRMLYRTQLLKAIAHKVREGMPYVGWSAGSNVACPTIMTTNDMPICEPPSLRAMHLVPFQINPHYTEATLKDHGGEGRDQRLTEFLALNRSAMVVGLREGALLHVYGGKMDLVGKGMRIFRHGSEPEEIAATMAMRTDLR
jgi:dipeptidase E